MKEIAFTFFNYNTEIEFETSYLLRSFLSDSIEYYLGKHHDGFKPDCSLCVFYTVSTERSEALLFDKKFRYSKRDKVYDIHGFIPTMVDNFTQREKEKYYCEISISNLNYLLELLGWEDSFSNENIEVLKKAVFKGLDNNPLFYLENVSNYTFEAYEEFLEAFYAL